MYYDQIDEAGTVVRSGFTLGAYDTLPKGHSWVPHTPPSATSTVPTSLTMRQARLALLQAGYLDAVDASVSSMSRADQISWEFANTVDRADPLTAHLAALLSLDDADLDALFLAGSAL